jgi:FixJ family two-component response regulator
VSAIKQPSDSLTAREREVLDLALRGHTSKESARKLGNGYRSVESHLLRVTGKLGKPMAQIRREVMEHLDKLRRFAQDVAESQEVPENLRERAEGLLNERVY